MVVLSKPAIEQFPYIETCCKSSSSIPLIELSKPDSKHLLVKACEEFGFFKVINHGVPLESISRLKSEAIGFFSLPFPEKEQSGPPNPFGYGSKCISRNGDVGWVEYLLLNTNQDSNHQLGKNPDQFRCALSDYISSVKRMACEILELMADGLKIQPRNVFSKLLMDEQSDSVFRLNHYPPCPDGNNTQVLNGISNLIGFGEHTEPQIISVLRSNNTSGLQISLRDGSWISVPPDQDSFYINVGDSLQTFVTISPIPGFIRWLLSKFVSQSKLAEVEDSSQSSGDRSGSAFLKNLLQPEEEEALMDLSEEFVAGEKNGIERMLTLLSNNHEWSNTPKLLSVLKAPLLRLCARYLLQEKRSGKALDSVANFHLQNGAVCHAKFI